MWYLSYVVDMRVERKNSVSDVHIMREFPDVILEDLLGVPPERQV